MAGAAIGLGNIWRFPYIVGQNGGAAFIVIYLAATLILSLPILLAESIIGRSSQANAYGAMAKLAPGTAWKWGGLLTVISPLIIVSYYSVVGGWSIGYLIRSIGMGFSENVSDSFSSFVSNPWMPLICHTVFILATVLVVSAGVKSGLEKFNKMSLPLLFAMIVIIMGYSLSLPGSSEGVRYLVAPDFSKITPAVMASAMGQSFYSLSLGVGAVLIYSSYMKKSDSLLGSGTGTAIFDILFALIAGFAIMPAVFAAGIEPGAGPGLVFETLPFIFVKMGEASPLLSRAVSIILFLTLAIAALTSSISMCEVGVAYLVEEKGISRKKACALVLVGTWLAGVLCSLSFGPLSGFTIAGFRLFDLFDYVTSNYLLTLGSLMYVIFVGWQMKKAVVRDEFTNGGTLKTSSKLFGAVYFSIRYIAPPAIIIIFLSNLLA